MCPFSPVPYLYLRTVDVFAAPPYLHPSRLNALTYPTNIALSSARHDAVVVNPEAAEAARTIGAREFLSRLAEQRPHDTACLIRASYQSGPRALLRAAQ